MSDTALNKIIQYGTRADRIAFTPSPASGSQVLYLWYETDHAPDVWAWDGSAWQQINTGGSGTVTSVSITAGTGITQSGSPVTTSGSITVNASTNTRTRAITATVNGGGSVPSTGVFADVWVPYGCVITANNMQADQSGSAVIDIWAATSSITAPTIANTIVASAPPTLSSAGGSQDSTLTGWTTAIAAGTWLRFNLNSVTTCTRVAATLTVTTT